MKRTGSAHLACALGLSLVAAAPAIVDAPPERLASEINLRPQ